MTDAELEERLRSLPPRKPYYGRGYGWLFTRHIMQADQGCDFDFLETGSAPQSPNPTYSERTTILDATTRDRLAKVSTATLTTALFKRGLRNQFLQDVSPVARKGRNMVGPAFTLRYIPAREDLNGLDVFQNPAHPQRVAIRPARPATCSSSTAARMRAQLPPAASSSPG